MPTSMNNRVLWTEGMLLTPQHFQQHDRYIDYLIQNKYACQQPYYWGFKSIKFSQELLTAGKVRLLNCVAIFPNGIFYNAPDVDLLPQDFDVVDTMTSQVIYLEIDNAKIFPYIPFNRPIVNIENNERQSMNVAMGQLNVRLSVKSEGKSNMQTLPMVKIKSTRVRGEVILSPQWIPPCLNYRVSDELNNNLEKLLFLIKTPLLKYVQWLKYDSSIAFGKIQTYALLQTLNRFYRSFQQIKNDFSVHPNQLYICMLEFLSELELHNIHGYNLFESYPYQHNRLYEVFSFLFNRIFKLLKRIFQTRAIKTVLTLKKHKLWVSEQAIPPLNLLTALILSIHASGDLKVVERMVLNDMKVAPLNKIHNLICHALPGIPIKALKKLPLDLMHEANIIYFSLEIEDENDSMPQSMACYFSAHIKDFELSLWHIRKS